jgi:hypothetical protein
LRFFAFEFDDEFELELLEELLDELLLEFDEELLEEFELEFMLELLEEFEDELLLEFPAVANGAPTATTPVAASAAAHFLLSIFDLTSGWVEAMVRPGRKPSVRSG